VNNAYNPYGNPYMQNAYSVPYGNPQNRISMLEQQKRDIENQISFLQNQGQTPMNQPLTINNNIVPNNQTQDQNKYDFKGVFLDDEDKIKDLYDSTLPIIIMSAKDSTFRIKNIDGTVTKYKFEEVKEEQTKNENNEVNNQEIENLKVQVQEQQIALNKIVGLLQANYQNNQVVENATQNVDNVKNAEIVEKSAKSRRGGK
jgi:hypothetical protein